MTSGDAHRMKKTRKSVRSERFRPGLTGQCEAQLWSFTGPANDMQQDHAPEMHWVAAESLDEAVQYMRQHLADFRITGARLVGVVALLSGSPLD
jgi:hypothetical protein